MCSSSADLSTSLSGGFSAACSANPNNPSAGNPAISREPGTSTDPVDDGRHIVFSLGNVTNSAITRAELRIVYEVVVLDSAENHGGTSLGNDVLWEWNGGDLSDRADEGLVVEPLLTLSKGASPTIAPPGTVIGFTLEVGHAAGSSTDAFDLILRDRIPDGLAYIPGSLQWTGEGLAPEPIDDSTAPDLVIRWNSFPAGARSVIRFQARLGNLRPGAAVINRAFLEWSSLPDDLSDPQSDFNSYSTERYYDPPSAVNVYGVESSVMIRVPTLPATGFAPGVVTRLPQNPKDFSYQRLGSLWLEIPDIGVKTPILGIPLKEDGWDLRWLWDQAGYLEGTAFPTLPGNTALTAHVYLSNGLPGPFVRLAELRWGDNVKIHAGNQTYIYEVRQVLHVRPEDLSVLKHEEFDWLTLITCEGYDEANESYLRRVAVRAVLVSVEE
jgi:LPXTG-site transpeptidase (sortase) family protein